MLHGGLISHVLRALSYVVIRVRVSSNRKPKSYHSSTGRCSFHWVDWSGAFFFFSLCRYSTVDPCSHSSSLNLRHIPSSSLIFHHIHSLSLKFRHVHSSSREWIEWFVLFTCSIIPSLIFRHIHSSSLKFRHIHFLFLKFCYIRLRPLNSFRIFLIVRHIHSLLLNLNNIHL